MTRYPCERPSWNGSHMPAPPEGWRNSTGVPDPASNTWISPPTTGSIVLVTLSGSRGVPVCVMGSPFLEHVLDGSTPRSERSQYLQHRVQVDTFCFVYSTGGMITVFAQSVCGDPLTAATTN